MVEAENDPRSDLAEDKLPGPRVADRSAGPGSRRAPERLLGTRVKKFIALTPKVRADADPRLIHDVRVCSRRLQQAISAFFPKPRIGKVRRFRRTPRRIRRALGEWRNCDVLLEMVRHRQRSARSEARGRAWNVVRDDLLERRTREVARAVKELLREDLADYGALASRLMSESPDESVGMLMQRLAASAGAAWSKWQSALARARNTRARVDLHSLRIATKALRYRTELLYDLGRQEQFKPMLEWLAELQEALGQWHDRQLLHEAVARAIARPEVLLSELPAARLLMAEIEREHGREAREVEKIFRLASAHPDYRFTP